MNQDNGGMKLTLPKEFEKNLTIIVAVEILNVHLQPIRD